jgi:hypothetical protein
MKRLIPVFILIILLSSCKKTESDFIWEKSYGKGEALFIRTSADSGFAACGKNDGKPYFIRFNKTRNVLLDFRAEIPGLFSSAWFDASGYITAGSSAGKMLLMHHSASGRKLWEKTLDGGFRIDNTQLVYAGNGNLFAVGTINPDSIGSGNPGLLFVRFDTTGLILTEKKIPSSAFSAANEGVAVHEAVFDNTGFIYLALTKKNSGSKTKAAVVKFGDQFQKLWETELFNNPDFAAMSFAVKLDGSGNLYIAGKTQLPAENSTLDNSFLVSLTTSGADRTSWKSKRYLESSNTGTALDFNDAGELMMLNKNCFIINIVNPSDGTDAGRIKMLGVCDSYNTDALGEDFDLNFDRNILVAGSFGGSFYLALKSSQ